MEDNRKGLRVVRIPQEQGDKLAIMADLLHVRRWQALTQVIDEAYERIVVEKTAHWGTRRGPRAGLVELERKEG